MTPAEVRVVTTTPQREQEDSEEEKEEQEDNEHGRCAFVLIIGNFDLPTPARTKGERLSNRGLLLRFVHTRPQKLPTATRMEGGP
eukprot:2492118-Pyramimonas_sp.AAC.1